MIKRNSAKPPLDKEFWNVFGRNAFSLYLLHGVVFWSAGSTVVSSSDEKD